ncbi:hypothetical protein HD806DRAFT_542423 [Xylariaceae sp. AK1471]|nr:hypothetical protein HD806DRAFT_542423 [Xylariaceae sp. AK1471]
MSLDPTHDELERLLAECETALSTVRKIINAYPSDLVAKVALPPLERSLRHLVNDIQGWIEGVNDRPLSAEHFDRLCRFVRQSRLSIIHPQAKKVGFKIHNLKPKPKPARRLHRPDLYSIPRVLALFVAQGLAFGVLDEFHTSPRWIGNFWVPPVASFAATYVMVLHFQASWVPTLCYLVAQGLCIWMGSVIDLRGKLGLLLILASIVASPSSIGTKSVGIYGVDV